MTDENSESDSDTEEKLKGEEKQVCELTGGEESGCVSCRQFLKISEPLSPCLPDEVGKAIDACGPDIQ